MPDKDQVFIFNKAELSTIKNTFSENDILLYTIRKVFLQFPLTEVEKGLIRTSVTPEVVHILKKRMLPDLSPEFPLGQIASILTTLTNDLKVKTPEEMEPHFNAKAHEIAYLTQQFNALEDLDAEQPIKLSDMASLDKETDEVFVNMTAYLFLLGYIDPMLNFIKSIAGQKDETPEEQEKRLMRDSSK